jgi:5-methylcytosine-specific restriction endonuclease McrA
LAKSLRPPRVILTDEQRKQRRRDEKRNYKHRRRAILRGQEVKATPKEIREAKDKARGICYYCRGKFGNLTIDHIVPIASGGGHTLDNIVFACHACNSKKRDLPANQFGEKFGLLIV